MNWHKRSKAPQMNDDLIAIAVPVYGSSRHATRPHEFLRWDCAIIEARQFNDATELEFGWPATEATDWAYITPPEEPQKQMGADV